MTKKNINAINRILASAGLIVLGLVLLFQSEDVLPFLRVILLWALAFFTLSRFVGVFIDHEHRKENLIYFGLYSLMLVILLRYVNIITRFVALIVGIYALINSFIQLVNHFIFRKNHVQGVIFALFRAIMDFFFGVALLLMPLVASNLIFVIAGAYLIVFGVFSSLSWIYILFNERFSVSISLPAILTAFLPARLYMRIKDNDDIKTEPVPSKYPLEISVYTHDGGFEAIGHMDVSIYGKTYSYGLHDPKTRRLFGSAGEGVLVVVDRSDFFKANLADGKTMIFNFQLDLNQADLDRVQERIDLLMKDVYPFDCDAKIEEQKGLPVQADDYISRVYRQTHCELYKFKSGPFKTYFVFSQNCIQLTDFLVRNQEIDLLMMSGIITPGAYLSFLYSLYEKNDSLVKAVDIYK